MHDRDDSTICNKEQGQKQLFELSKKICTIRRKKEDRNIGLVSRTFFARASGG